MKWRSGTPEANGRIVLVTAALAVIGVCLVIGHQKKARLREENRGLQKQLDELVAVAQTRQAVSNVLAPDASDPSLPAEQFRELLRLRGEASMVQSQKGDARKLRSANLLVSALSGPEPFRLSLEEVQPFLERCHRSADSLLGAFRVTGEKSLLQEALAAFPTDARLNFEAVFATDSAQERRQRLEAFKQLAPDNALANYLSARYYFASGQTDEGVQELVAAAAKPNWQNYAADMVRTAEEAYRGAGYSEAAAQAAAGRRLQVPEALQLTLLGKSLADLASQYRQAGDEASAQTTLETGLNLSRRLGQSTGYSYLVENMDGILIERRMLSVMDPASQYAGTGQTVKARLEQLDQRVEDLARLDLPPEGWPESGNILQTLSEQDLVAFFERIKVSGEAAALRWAKNKQGKP